MTLAAIEYTDARQMLADYADRRRRLYQQRPEPVAAPEPVAEQVKPKVLVFPVSRVVTVDEVVARYRYAHPHCKLFASERLGKVRDGFTDGASILRIVVKHTGVTLVDLASDRRRASLVRVRQVACWLMRHHTLLSFPQIGAKLGGRDHTTILHAVRKIDGLRERDPAIKQLTDELSEIIKAEFGE